MRRIFFENVVDETIDFLDNNQRIKLKEILTEICIYLCSEKGVPDVVLKELMGHADSDTTTQYYIHISLDRKKKEIQRLWE